jgi:hypothetical protein
MVSLLNQPGLDKFTDGPIFGNLKFGAGGEDGEDEAKPTLLEIGVAIAVRLALGNGFRYLVIKPIWR